MAVGEQGFNMKKVAVDKEFGSPWEIHKAGNQRYPGDTEF